MIRVLLVLAACTLPVAADADSKKSAKHSMQWTEGDTVHIADERGAINRDGDVRIDVEVFSSKRVVVTDAGKRNEHNLYENYSSDEETVWTNVWKGTWKGTGATMELDLKLHDRKCTHTKTWSDAAPETEPCATVSKTLALTCNLAKVTLENAAKVAAWTCMPTGTAELADTPSTWVLGKAGCVRVLSSHFGKDHYETCARR